MSIYAKRIDAAGTVTTIQLADGPSDIQLIDALGGGDLVIRGQIRGWEVLATMAEGKRYPCRRSAALASAPCRSAARPAL